jgi:hypothetical protein
MVGNNKKTSKFEQEDNFGKEITLNYACQNESRIWGSNFMCIH